MFKMYLVCTIVLENKTITRAVEETRQIDPRRATRGNDSRKATVTEIIQILGRVGRIQRFVETNNHRSQSSQMMEVL